jgi:hypothetical protein
MGRTTGTSVVLLSLAASQYYAAAFELGVTRHVRKEPATAAPADKNAYFASLIERARGWAERTLARLPADDAALERPAGEVDASSNYTYWNFLPQVSTPIIWIIFCVDNNRSPDVLAQRDPPPRSPSPSRAVPRGDSPTLSVARLFADVGEAQWLPDSNYPTVVVHPAQYEGSVLPDADEISWTTSVASSACFETVRASAAASADGAAASVTLTFSGARSRTCAATRPHLPRRRFFRAVWLLLAVVPDGVERSRGWIRRGPR